MQSVLRQAALNFYTLLVPYITIGDKPCTPTLFVPCIAWARIPKLTVASFTSLVHKPPPFFALRFVFSIIGVPRASLFFAARFSSTSVYKGKLKNRNGGCQGTRLAFWCFYLIYWAVPVFSAALTGKASATFFCTSFSRACRVSSVVFSISSSSGFISSGALGLTSLGSMACNEACTTCRRK